MNEFYDAIELRRLTKKALKGEFTAKPAGNIYSSAQRNCDGLSNLFVGFSLDDFFAAIVA